MKNRKKQIQFFFRFFLFGVKKSKFVNRLKRALPKFRADRSEVRGVNGRSKFGSIGSIIRSVRSIIVQPTSVDRFDAAVFSNFFRRRKIEICKSSETRVAEVSRRSEPSSRGKPTFEVRRRRRPLDDLRVRFIS